MNWWKQAARQAAGDGPLAHVAVLDAEKRSAVAAALRAEGWSVKECASGYELVQSLAGAILGQEPWLRPDLIAVDAVSPGCCGSSIARGVRQLGWSMPIALIVWPAHRSRSVLGDPDDSVYAVDAGSAAAGIAALARRYRPTDPRGGASARLSAREQGECAWLPAAPAFTERAAA